MMLLTYIKKINNYEDFLEVNFGYITTTKPVESVLTAIKKNLYHYHENQVLDSLRIVEPCNQIPTTLNTDLTLSLGENFASVLFLIGLFGILLNQKNILIIFLCVELMLFGAGVHFLFSYLFFNYELGQVYALLVLTVATAETAIGLGILILAYRLNRTISFDVLTTLKG